MDVSLRPWLILREIDGIGDVTLVKLVLACGSPEAVFQASEEILIDSGCSRAVIAAIRRGPGLREQERADKELKRLEKLEKLKVRVLTYTDPRYPARLKSIADPPPLLYMSGTLLDDDSAAVAVVGARRATAGGRVVTEQLSRDLARAGFTVVSGLARGIDAAAHRGALAGGGRTIAVLGCGIDRTYPPEHDRLRAQIEGAGAVLSELPLGSPPHNHHFPRRNRIISGLSLGVVVTQAAINSGSLITARVAAEQGRGVFAVPGFVKEDTSRGPHALIREGATLVECARDVVDELLPQLEPGVRTRVAARGEAGSEGELGKEEALVYDALSYDPIPVDTVIGKTGLAPSQVTAALLSLELRQRVRQLPGQRFHRA